MCFYSTANSGVYLYIKCSKSYVCSELSHDVSKEIIFIGSSATESFKYIIIMYCTHGNFTSFMLSSAKCLLMSLWLSLASEHQLNLVKVFNPKKQVYDINIWTYSWRMTECYCVWYLDPCCPMPDVPFSPSHLYEPSGTIFNLRLFGVI